MPCRPRILYYEMLAFQPENLELLMREFEMIVLPTPAEDSVDILSRVDACFAPLGYHFDSIKMDCSPSLRAIISNTTGVPHIDMAAAASRGISVFSLKDEQDFLDTITPTAEHAFGLMLALLRRMPWSFDAVLKGNWNRFEFGAPAMLSRLSLGVVGLGRLGKMMARYGEAFGMSVRYFDPNVEHVQGRLERIEKLSDLLAWSDVISVHVPAEASTHHLIDRSMFSQMKASAVLINTARGEIIDQAALLDALIAGTLAGAAVDVLDGEYEPGFDASSHPLVRYAKENKNLIITPHIGGSTIDAWQETQRRVVELAISHFTKITDNAW